MTTLTSWVDYQYAEQAAAVMVRGLSGASSAWGELLADAQTILAHRSDTRDSEYLMSYGFDDWSDLVSAARILDLAGTDGGLGDHDNRTDGCYPGGLCIRDVRDVRISESGHRFPRFAQF